jgi:photosystem II stability/assembly factor-like uncharacterized protein
MSSQLRHEIATVFEEELEPSPRLDEWVFLDREPNRPRAWRLARLVAAASALLVVSSAGYYAYWYGVPGLTRPAPAAAPADDGQFLSTGVFTSRSSGWIVRRASGDTPDHPGVTTDAVFQTTDGGASWHERMRFKGEYDSMVFSADGSRGVLWALDTTAPQCTGAAPACMPAARPALVFRTTDSGATWQPMAAPSGNLVTGAFLDPDHGWLLTDGADAGPGGQMGVYATSDGGATWQRAGAVGFSAYSSYGVVFGTGQRSLAFADAVHGWLVPNSYNSPARPALLATADGGRTWQGVTLGLPAGMGGEISAGQPRLFAGGTGILPIAVRSPALDPAAAEPPSQVLVYSTADGGLTWQSPRPLFPAGSAQASETVVGTMGIWDFRDATHWWVTNQTGTGGGPWAPRPHLLVTADGGRSWKTYDNSPAISDLFFTSATDGWAEDQTVGPGGNLNGLIRTTDGGAHWTRIGLPRIR